MKKIRVNVVSESDIYVQGHGVHTAYVEMAEALEKRSDAKVIRGGFKENIDADIIHLHTFGMYAFRKALQRGPKKVFSAHVVPASLIGSIIGARYWMPAMRLYMRWYYNKADKVLAVSRKVSEVLQDELHVPKEKIEVFHNTIDMSRYAFTTLEKANARKKLNLKKNDFMVLGIGQIQPRKRLDIFVAMAKRLPDVTFVWIGGIPFKQLGADYHAMQKLMNSAPKNLKLVGILPHEKVADYLAAANAFCLPAEQENHPMCVLEAAGADLPVVVRDIPEYDDTFKDDVIRCTDDDFATAIAKLRDDKKFYSAQQIKTKRIAERFDSKNAAERFMKLYKDLLTTSPGRTTTPERTLLAKTK
jgi:1,2-diacylglycerol-3-alpha-glucose alpha-1,2-galactosyltransferase